MLAGVVAIVLLKVDAFDMLEMLGLRGILWEAYESRACGGLTAYTSFRPVDNDSGALLEGRGKSDT